MKKIGNLEKEILSVLKYFFFFNYPPSVEDIYTFLKKKTSRRRLAIILEKMVKKSIVIRIFDSQIPIFRQISIFKPLTLKERQNISPKSYFLSRSNNLPRYTLPQYTIKTKAYSKRHNISLKKIQKISMYVKLLSLVSAIKLIGLSGSVAMLNAGEDHDVDLFIVTAKNRLFTGRFIALLLAQIMGVRRTFQIDRNRSDLSDYSDRPSLRHSDKVCLNLFFDESDLKIPKFKQSEYVAHEVLQMKPFTSFRVNPSITLGVNPSITLGVNPSFVQGKPFDFSWGKPFDYSQGKLLDQEGDIYRRFIDSNKWVFDIFPNAKFQTLNPKSQINSKSKIQNSKRFEFRNLNLFGALNLVFSILGWIIETILKHLQLYFINRHRTTEIITDTQLWFHPDDFEKKVKNKYM